MGTSVRRCCLASINACMPRVLVKLEESTVHPPPTHTLSVHAAVCDGCLYTANPIKSNVYAVMPMVCARAHTDTQTHTQSSMRRGLRAVPGMRWVDCKERRRKHGREARVLRVHTEAVAGRLGCERRLHPRPPALALNWLGRHALRPGHLPHIKVLRYEAQSQSVQAQRRSGVCLRKFSLSLSVCLCSCATVRSRESTQQPSLSVSLCMCMLLARALTPSAPSSSSSSSLSSSLLRPRERAGCRFGASLPLAASLSDAEPSAAAVHPPTRIRINHVVRLYGYA
jgi:hypothetical protein